MNIENDTVTELQDLTKMFEEDYEKTMQRLTKGSNVCIAGQRAITEIVMSALKHIHLAIEAMDFTKELKDQKTAALYAMIAFSQVTSSLAHSYVNPANIYDISNLLKASFDAGVKEAAAKCNKKHDYML